MSDFFFLFCFSNKNKYLPLSDGGRAFQTAGKNWVSLSATAGIAPTAKPWSLAEKIKLIHWPQQILDKSISYERVILYIFLKKFLYFYKCKQCRQR